MKQIVMISVAVLIALVQGCAANKQIENNYVETAQMLQGTWQEFGGKTYEILTTNNIPKLITIIDSDMEVFEVRESNWKNGNLSWTYYVPSTGYVVYMATTSISENEIQCTWRNDYDSGTDILTKIKTNTKKSSKKAKPGR